MNPELVYSVTNIAALAAWLVLVCYPLRREPILVAARTVAAVLSVVYVALLARSLSEGGAPDFSTLAAVSALFAHPGHAVMGWTHYLAFDLWVGTWEVEEAARRRLPYFLVLPCLALTFLVGPVGLVAFLVLCAGWRLRRPETV